jgi:acetyl esterase/lipase
MADTDALPAVSLPARQIPVPTSVSEQARAIIAMGQLQPSLAYPPLEDLDGWRTYVATQDANTLAMLGDRTSALPVDVEAIDPDGVPVYILTPHAVEPDDRRVYLDIHGGGLIMGAGELCRLMCTGTAMRVAARVWAVDYRMPPDHPYPTPLDDCLAAYRALLQDHRPEDIVVGGASAGGNLAAALILRARDEGLPMPAGAVLMTPEADLTESGDSFLTNLGLDPLLTQSAMPANLLYANGHDLTDPYLSPLFGDFTKGFPPSFLSTGTRDLFLSNTVLLHCALRAAGVPADLYVTEAGGHGGFLGTAPEDVALTRQIRIFAESCWNAAD